MKLIKTQDAVGQILCHDITQIIPGVKKGAVFKKGHIITEDDIPVLLSVGKENIYIWENDGTLLHENDAAQILCEICRGENMSSTEAGEGKIEIVADIDALFIADTEQLKKLNALGEMMVATRLSGFPVKKGDKLCGTRIIPLAIEKEKMEHARQVAGSEPLLRLVELKQKTFGVVTTGSEVFSGRIEDAFTPVLVEKLGEYGCKMTSHVVLGDDSEKITAAINDMLEQGCQMVFCTGGMSVDPDDRTPVAIKNTGAKIISYGSPVLPGAMFLVAYSKDGRPVCGLPGCVMYSKRTVFDIVLPRLLADIPITAEWLSSLGNGGLCLNCEVCHFPNCMFGKGA